MTGKLSVIALVASLVFTDIAAQSALIIPDHIRMPKDSIAAKQLVSSLNKFMALKDGPNEQNSYITKTAYLETATLVDEMKDIERNEKLKDSSFYKLYLQNAVRLDSISFLVQLAAIGVKNNVPVLRAGFELIAYKEGDHYSFASPLQRNTALWKTKIINGCTFHYKHDASAVIAAGYEKNAAFFDKKLLVKDRRTEMYLCDDFPEALAALGVCYKADYNGYVHNLLLSRNAQKTLFVRGADPAESFDPHDEWHERLHNILPASMVNKPVDEGCAYLYGGSWGLSWQDILSQFKTKVASNPSADWLTLYESFHNFADSSKQPLMTGYVINALIVQKIEKEKGSAAVLELLRCGKYEKGNENYFKTLEKLTGINRANFNEKVWALVKQA
ncbi:hypothetical protein ACTHGU_13170 [Chitinophagaceae bacterium MMS25-I14]